MVHQASRPPAVVTPQVVTELEAEFELEPNLALRWIDSILAQGSEGLKPNDVVYLLHCRAGLAGILLPIERIAQESPHPSCAGLLRSGLSQGIQSGAFTPAANPRFGAVPSADTLLNEMWNAVVDKGNRTGTAANALMLLSSLYHGLPATWHVTLQGGQWELYDANKNARIHAFGKAGKARFLHG